MKPPRPATKPEKSKGLTGRALELAVLRLMVDDPDLVAHSRRLPDGTLTEPTSEIPRELVRHFLPPEPAKRGRKRAIPEDSIAELYERAKQRLSRNRTKITDETVALAMADIFREQGGPPDFSLSPETVANYRKAGLTKAA